MPAEQQLEKMIHKYGDSIFRMCYLYLKDYHLAEDAVQETFIKVLKNQDSFKNQSSEKTWIVRIAINTCKNIMRKRWYYGMIPMENEKEEYVNDETENMIEHMEVSKAIMSLSPKYREVILLFYYQELRLKEIADMIGKSENVVTQRLYRARLALRKQLEKGGFQYE